VFVPPRWLASASKFVLEAGPLVSAVAVAAYLAGSFYVSATSGKQEQAAVVLPMPDEWTLSGADLTDLVLSAHEPANEPAHAAAEPKTITAEAAAVPMPPARPAKVERPRTAQASPAAKNTSQPTAVLALPAPGPAAPVRSSQTTAAVHADAPEPKRTLLGRTWQTVTVWGDRTVEAVTEAPAAVARVGKKTVQTIASAATSILP
jgi:hypothetical protein